MPSGAYSIIEKASIRIIETENGYPPREKKRQKNP